MLEERMERAKALLVERLTDGMDLVALGQIKAKEVAPRLTKRLVARAEALLERERERRANSGLSYDHPRVKAILERLDDVLLDVTTFSRAEIEQVVEEQVRREIMLRMRPVDAIFHIVLSKERTLSVSEVVEALAKLPVQAFYGEGMRAYGEEYADEVLDRETLVGILRKIEERASATDAVGMVMKSASSILEFLRQRRVEDGDEVDLDIIEKILTYYKMRDQARVIKVERMLGRERLTLGQVRRILEVTEDSEEAEEESVEMEGWSVEMWAQKGGEREKGREGEGEQKREGEGEGEEEREEKEGESTEKTVPELEEEESRGRVSEEGVEEAVGVVSRPERSLDEVVAEKEERYFIRKLFARDREIYELLMEQLEGAPTWEEANKIIQKFWEDHGIDAGSKAAERFADAIFKRYPPHGEQDKSKK